jgi:hypothetical protein
MAPGRKRRTTHPRAAQAGGSKPPKKVKDREQGAERLCWLCSRPLTVGAVKSMLGFGVFEVHQRCYEEALKS